MWWGKCLKMLVSEDLLTSNMLNGLPRLPKSAQQHFRNIYWSIAMKFNWKMSFLIICKIFWLFFNTSTADGQYSLFNRYNLRQRIQMQLSNKKNLLLNFFVHSLNVDQILNILKKKMTFISYVFLKLRTVKDVVR